MKKIKKNRKIRKTFFKILIFILIAFLIWIFLKQRIKIYQKEKENFKIAKQISQQNAENEELRYKIGKFSSAAKLN